MSEISSKEEAPQVHQKPERFELIDILRGFAAITILVYHTIALFQWNDFPDTSIWLWFRWGWLGVDIFFVISGFVITCSALDLREKYHGSELICKFMGRRFRRIAPLHYLTIILYVALVVGFNTPGIYKGILIHMAFIYNLFPQYFDNINGVNWSIATEMQFYLLVIIIAPFMTSRSVFIYIFIFITITWVWRFYGFIPPDSDDDNKIIKMFQHISQLPGMLDLFCSGIMAAWFVKSKYFHKLAKKYWFRMAILALFALSVYAMVAIYGCLRVYWDNVWMVTFFRSVISMVFGSLLLFLCLFKPVGLVRYILSPLIYIGTISYGIYLFHLIVILYVKDIEISNISKLGLTLFITLILASFSWHFFEKRFIYNK